MTDNTKKTFGGFPASNIYSHFSNTVQTSSETIPEDEERQNYNDQVASTGGGTAVVDKKGIFIGFGVLVLALVLLNMIE